MSTTVTQRGAADEPVQMYLEKHDREVKRYRIIPVDAAATLYSDLQRMSRRTSCMKHGFCGPDECSPRSWSGTRLRPLRGKIAPRECSARTHPADRSNSWIDSVWEVSRSKTTPNEFLDMTTYNRCP